MKRNKLLALVGHLFLILLLASCSGQDYVSAVPGDCKVVVAIDFGKMSGVDNKALLKAVLHVGKVDNCGLDFSEKAYLFSTSDGDLGLCLKVDDESKLRRFLSEMNSQGKASAVTDRRGFGFSVIDRTWMAGFSSSSFLLMGPVAAGSQAQVQQQITTYLSQEEEKSLLGSRLWEKLDSLQAPMSMVAQVQALPEKLAAPLMLGAPKEADASQVLVAATMRTADRLLYVEGRPFSFNSRVNQFIDANMRVLRPIGDTYLRTLPQTTQTALLTNVEGTSFLPLLQADKPMQALLAGVNTAIDMDNIIRSINGDMAVSSRNVNGRQEMSMCAKLSHSRWLADVDYWKQSCPSGSSIVDWDNEGYIVRNGETTFYFGVSPDLQFYSGGSPDEARSSTLPSDTPFPEDIIEKMRGCRLALVASMVSYQNASSSFPLFRLFDKVETMLYVIK
ncbi:MAG: DUF4836 family protein [Prevotella sp.]|nr:DUF4836 family protein [Prevotella sp.]